MSHIHYRFPLFFPILVGALSVTASAATVGCSSSNAAAPNNGDAGTLDGSPDTGPCVGTLENVRNTWSVRCGDTAAADFAAGVPCGGDPGIPTFLTSTCGGLDVVEYLWETHAQYCFYPADGGSLVAATANDDTPSFCASSSYAISAGPVLETVDQTEGTRTWSVSGQACAMAAPDAGACAHDGGAD